MDRSALRAELARKNLSGRDLAAALKLSSGALSNKMKGVSEFKESEIRALARLLDLTPDGVNAIFFGL